MFCNTLKRLSGYTQCRLTLLGYVVLQVEEETVSEKDRSVLSTRYRDANQYDLKWLTIGSNQQKRVEKELNFKKNAYLTGKVAFNPGWFTDKVYVLVEEHTSIYEDAGWRRARSKDIKPSLLKPNKSIINKA